LTGFIPAFLPGRFGSASPVWFRANRQISGFCRQEPSFPGRIISARDAQRQWPLPERNGKHESETENRGRVMLSWVVTFLVIALIAGILGFGGIAGVSVEIAKAIFFIAVVLFLVSAVVGLARGRTNV
jgi:uncharacterized membrane protein YtjA (UPF0391 family)